MQNYTLVLAQALALDETIAKVNAICKQTGCYTLPNSSPIDGIYELSYTDMPQLLAFLSIFYGITPEKAQEQFCLGNIQGLRLRQSINKDSFAVSYCSGLKYADIEFFANGDALVANAVFGQQPFDPQVYRLDLANANVYDEIQKLIAFVNS